MPSHQIAQDLPQGFRGCSTNRNAAMPNKAMSTIHCSNAQSLTDRLGALGGRCREVTEEECGEAV